MIFLRIKSEQLVKVAYFCANLIIKEKKKMSNPKNISIEEYNYPLPDERIAKFPLENRDDSKLLVYRNGSVSQSVFRNLADELPNNLLMVFNNTKVIQARMVFAKETGARIEVFCLEPHEPSDYALVFQAENRCVWQCMIGNAKKWKSGDLLRRVDVRGKEVELRARRVSADGSDYYVEFEWSGGVSFAEVLDAAGELPIPPYLHRETCERDKETYQTVYSKIKGSVAAPTAGLHFTPSVFERLAERGVKREEVTLHVGAGTFQPVKSDTIGEHQMHTEFISVKRSSIENIKENLGRVVAVGTTSVRTVESLYFLGVMVTNEPDLPVERLKVEQWSPYSGGCDVTADVALGNLLKYMDAHNLDTLNASTQIIIAPGYSFKIVKGIVTNFHQPQSTLLLLISAFVGEDWKRIYDYALKNDFRFLSYGDSSLLLPQDLG